MLPDWKLTLQFIRKISYDKHRIPIDYSLHEATPYINMVDMTVAPPQLDNV